MAKAFWSYRTDDDRHDDGLLSTLARAVKSEYEMVAGEELELFLDKDRLAWGDDWRQEINDAVLSAAFFIPVLTPRYFQSEYCREEFSAFVAKAHRLGAGERILSLSYVPVADIVVRSSDTVMAMAARYQHRDISHLRRAATTGPEFRQVVQDLARELHGIANHMKHVETRDKPAERPMLADVERSAADAALALRGALQGFDETVSQLHKIIADGMQPTAANGREKSDPTLTVKTARKLGPVAKSLDMYAARFGECVAQIDSDVRFLLSVPAEELSRDLVDRRRGLRVSVAGFAEETLRTHMSIERLMRQLCQETTVPPSQSATMHGLERAFRRFLEAQSVLGDWVI